MQPAATAVPSRVAPHRRPAVRDGLSLETVARWLHLHSFELIIWAYFISAAVYKRWYIVTAIALVITVTAAALGAITLRRVVPAILPFLLYHGYQFLGILWSDYPEGVIFTASSTAIGSAIAFLAWSLVRNHSPDAISDIFVRLPYPALAVTIIDLVTRPEAIRSGGYSLNFMALAVPFCYARIMAKRRPKWAGLSLFLALMILIVGRSRSPMAAAAIAGLLAFLLIGRGLMARLRVLALGLIALPLLAVVLMSFETTRKTALTTFVRFTKQEVLQPDLYIAAEGLDHGRAHLDELVPTLMWEAQPLGIGVGAYRFYHERAYGYPLNLHNVFELWLVEGGVVLVSIVLFILWRHVRALFRTMKTPARDFAKCVLIMTICVLAMGVFHRIDLSFWIIVGFGVGLRDVYGRRRVRRS